MPLEIRHGRYLQEYVLPRLVFHRRLLELNFHGTYIKSVWHKPVSEPAKHTIWMFDDFGDFCLLLCSNLSPHSLKEVHGKSPDGEPPALVSDAMFPKGSSSKRRVRFGSVTDKTPNSMRVKSEEEDQRKMMRIPERFVTLLSDLVVGAEYGHVRTMSRLG